MRETEDPQIIRYIEGLKPDIKKEFSMHNIYCLSDAMTLTGKDEITCNSFRGQASLKPSHSKINNEMNKGQQ